MEKIACLIVGGGPAGYTAALYAARSGLKPVLFEGMQPGGQLTTTAVIENFPGFKDGVGTFELLDAMRAQAERFGADIRSGVVEEVDFSGKVKKLRVGETWLEADAVIVATGAAAKYLGLPSEEKYKGRGVSVCATCDGFFFRGREVAVVGGGDSACEEALYLASICSKVSLIVRRNVLRASKVMQEKVAANPRVEILYECSPVEVIGDGNVVTGIRLEKKGGGVFEVKTDGIFVAVGAHPASELFSEWLETDELGYIVTRDGQKTSVEGVFAAGDVQDSRYRQAITAAASGCRAAMDLELYLKNEK